MQRDEKGRFVSSKKLTTNTELTHETMSMGRTELSRLIGLQYSQNRDIDSSLGYTSNPGFDDFKGYYDRRGLASTIVDAPAKTTWRISPTITDGSEDKSEFVKGWEALNERLNICHYLERVDRLAGIGEYGVLLIGTKDGDLKSPLERVSSQSDIIFLSAFSENSAKIKSFVTDVNDPRFGKPYMYEIDLNGDLVSTGTITKELVHWTRVIHVAEGLLENEVYGEPRLKKVFNRLEDLDKIVGASAEGHWQTAVPGYVISPKKDWDADTAALTAAKTEFQNWIHGLQRELAMEGLDVETLGGMASDPTAAFNVVMSLISGKTRIPKRILLGTEAGSLASSQDESNWLGTISERQLQFAEPTILRALIRRLIDIGALNEASGGRYNVEWTPLFYLNELEMSMVHLRNAQAIKSIESNSEEEIITKEEKRMLLGLPSTPNEVQ